MSYRSLLKHRCNLFDLEESQEYGESSYEFKQVNDTPVRCFLDLGFIRKGKDPYWTPEAGRPSERTGVCFFMGDAPIKAGMYIQMVKGPEGIYSIEGALDEAWVPDGRHHLEIGVKEVAPQRARKLLSQP